MKQFQKLTKYFLSYWVLLTLIPGIINNTNQFFDFVIASAGFVLVVMAIPHILTFLKINIHELYVYLIYGSILSVIYTFTLKPGILGIIYFPKTFVINGTISSLPTLNTDIGELGAIIFVGVGSLLLGTFLTRKFR